MAVRDGVKHFTPPLPAGPLEANSVLRDLLICSLINGERVSMDHKIFQPKVCTLERIGVGFQDLA